MDTWIYLWGLVTFVFAVVMIPAQIQRPTTLNDNHNHNPLTNRNARNQRNPTHRFTIGIVVIQKADVYMFDEPSSYLDVKQRCVAGARVSCQSTHAHMHACIFLSPCVSTCCCVL
jgi:ABC-type Na+ transport system ATPase subunit NatA